jgi:uncharacterized protein YuzE
MQIQYDPEADAIYVSLRTPRGLVKGDRIDNRRTVCYDERDQIVGVEFLFVSHGIDLEAMPAADEIDAALRSFPRAAA